MKIRPHKVVTGNDLPAQLVIKDGKLIASDNTEPDFSEMMDGTYNLVSRAQYAKVIDDAHMLRYWGA